jgi:hypothetical protein
MQFVIPFTIIISSNISSCYSVRTENSFLLWRKYRKYISEILHLMASSYSNHKLVK